MSNWVPSKDYAYLASIGLRPAPEQYQDDAVIVQAIDWSVKLPTTSLLLIGSDVRSADEAMLAVNLAILDTQGRIPQRFSSVNLLIESCINMGVQPYSKSKFLMVHWLADETAVQLTDHRKAIAVMALRERLSLSNLYTIASISSTEALSMTYGRTFADSLIYNSTLIQTGGKHGVTGRSGKTGRNGVSGEGSADPFDRLAL